MIKQTMLNFTYINHTEQLNHQNMNSSPAIFHDTDENCVGRTKWIYLFIQLNSIYIPYFSPVHSEKNSHLGLWTKITNTSTPFFERYNQIWAFGFSHRKIVFVYLYILSSVENRLKLLQKDFLPTFSHTLY